LLSVVAPFLLAGGRLSASVRGMRRTSALMFPSSQRKGAQLRFLDLPMHVAQAARARRILELASTIAAFTSAVIRAAIVHLPVCSSFPLDVGLVNPKQ